MDILFWATRPLPHYLKVRAFGAREKFRLANATRPATLDTSLLRTSLPDFASVEEPKFANDLAELSGAVNPGERRAIYALIRAMNARHVLEVGTHVGGSSRYIVKALQQNGGGRLTSVDIYDVNAPTAAWAQLGLKQSPKEALAALGADSVQVDFFAQPSIEYLRSSKEKFDLIFLDGGHEAPTVLTELPLALRLLNPDGLIVLHDYFPRLKPIWKSGYIEYGPWLAVQALEAVPGGEHLRVESLGELPWPTKEGSRRTCLATVLRK